MAEKYQPLVSVPVVTYNSSATVIETLDSIYNQTYSNIELIVSDDCSTDNTVEICKNWIEQHKERFVRTELLTVEKNTGVSANGNRARTACKGEWIKGIAGDDIMMSNCIEEYIKYVHIHPNVEFVFSRIEAFGPNQQIVENYNTGKIFDYSLFELDTQGQWEKFVLEDAHIPAPTLFSLNGAMEKYNVKNDERIPFTEDEPKWINLLKAGAHLDFMDKITIRYRVGHTQALSSSNKAIPPYRYESIIRFFVYYKFVERYKRNSNKAIEDFIAFTSNLYNSAYNDGSAYKQRKLNRIKKYIQAPMDFFKKHK